MLRTCLACSGIAIILKPLLACQTLIHLRLTGIAVCLAVVVCFFSAFATLKISQFEFDFGSVGGGNGVLTSSFGGGYTLDIDKHINDLAKENRVTIYPFRRNKIKKEIQLSGDNSLKNIELIINNNINELKTLTK